LSIPFSPLVWLAASVTKGSDAQHIFAFNIQISSCVVGNFMTKQKLYSAGGFEATVRLSWDDHQGAVPLANGTSGQHAQLAHR